VKADLLERRRDAAGSIGDLGGRQVRAEQVEVRRVARGLAPAPQQVDQRVPRFLDTDR